jgi:hypothetical protein
MKFFFFTKLSINQMLDFFLETQEFYTKLIIELNPN